MLKAKDNPFRSSRLEKIRYELPSDVLETLVDQALNESCSCLLGPKGTGKSTLLEDLEPLLQQRGYTTHWIRLTLESPHEDHTAARVQVKQLGKGEVCLVDGAEVLSFVNWHRLCWLARKNQMTLIATLHRKRGVSILRRTQPDWALMQRFVRQLSGTYYTNQLNDHAQLAFQTSHGNMREVFRACYLALARR
jgi:energy-coupling factor transporter ATP-binding protein EcfA2